MTMAAFTQSCIRRCAEKPHSVPSGLPFLNEKQFAAYTVVLIFHLFELKDQFDDPSARLSMKEYKHITLKLPFVPGTVPPVRGLSP